MREMNPVVACSVIPSTMHVDKLALLAGQRQMAIGLVKVAAGALPLEVENDVGKRIALQDIFVNLEGAGTDLCSARRNLERIVAGLLPR